MMRGPPGFKAPRSSPLARSSSGRKGGWLDTLLSSSPSVSHSGKQRKASRLLVYIRLHKRQIALQAFASVAVLFLLYGLFSLIGQGTSYGRQSNGGDTSDFNYSASVGTWGLNYRGGWKAERRRVDLPRVSLDINSEAAKKGWGTDVYVASREGESLGTWDPQKGLEIEALDVRGRSALASNLTSLGVELRVANKEAAHFLSIVLPAHLRKGATNLTFSEVKQWLEFCRYAGVSHVFWYDTAPSPEDSLEFPLRPYVKSGFVTYHHLGMLFASSSSNRTDRDKAVLHCLTHYGMRSHWVLPLSSFTDYPVTPSDISPGFLDRYLRDYEAHSPSTSQLLLQIFVVDGPPESRSSPLIIERFMSRRVESQGVSLRPPSVLLPAIRPPDVLLLLWHPLQHFEMARGTTRVLPAAALRVLRYAGAEGGSTVSPSIPHVRDNTLLPLSEELSRLLEQKRPGRGSGRGWFFFGS